MLFLKVTKSASQFGARFGWLIAELVFVFMGLYGAFLLERMHDEDMDLLRKRQILQALVDEFENYETELGTASESLDEAYGVPFFQAYGSGERPFPRPIPYGGMGSVNTGIWEAMLQSGGIEVLEVGVIQKVQSFFKKLQDLLDLYSRFERLSENMILPEMDREVGFFYETEGSELRDKYKWYVNSLFTIGISLQGLTSQAAETKEVLLAEFERIKNRTIKKSRNQPRRNGMRLTHDPIIPAVEEESAPEPAMEAEISPQPSVVEGIAPQPAVEEKTGPEPVVSKGEAPPGLAPEERIRVLEFLGGQFQKLGDHLGEIKLDFDDPHAIPFFTSYGEGERPVPYFLPADMLDSVDPSPLSRIMTNQGIIRALSTEEINTLGTLLLKITETKGLHQIFAQRCRAEIPAAEDRNASLFYSAESTELKESFLWFPNTMFTLGTALEDCHEETLSLSEMLIEDAAHASSLLKSEFAEHQSLDSNQTAVTENE